MDKKKAESSSKPAATFKIGAIALVFLIIGYQVALFVARASAMKLVSHQDRPDTVYVVERHLAEQILSEQSAADTAGTPFPQSGPETMSQLGNSGAAESQTVMIRRNSSHPREAVEVKEKISGRTYESFRFNPNTVSVQDLCRLGFSLKQAEAIDAYRQKGGRFRRKSDFAKSYVVADSVFERLEPFVDIPLVDLNSADSAAFDALPGIGPFFAAKMVEHRAELHGYSYPEQLMDIWKFDQERFDGLKDLITVGIAEPYALWTLPEDSLKLHPYIGSYAAHGVVLFRENSPKGEWTVENLAAAGILKPENAAKLARCRIAAP